MKHARFVLAIGCALLSVISLSGCGKDPVRPAAALDPWVRTSGPGGGSVNAYAAIGSILFAGSFNGGVYRSTDDGVSWTAVNHGLFETDVRTLAFHSTTLFAGTGHGVFRST